MHKIVIGLSLIFSLQAYADTAPMQHDFAEGMQLQLQVEAPIYRLKLPEKVYNISAFPDLRDLRVFNSQGVPVPHVIRDQKYTLEEKNYSTDVPLFPVYRDLSRQDITFSNNGQILEIEKRETVTADSGAGIKHYLVDMSEVTAPVEKIELGLSGIENGFSGKIHIESSHDLDNWRTLVKEAAIAVMNYGEHTLKKDQIDLPRGKFRYLRISWLNRDDQVRVESVRAHHTSIVKDQNLNWSRLQGQPVRGESGLYEYKNSARLPIQRIELLLPENNTLIDAEIRSRKDEDQSRWHTRVNRSFYRLDWQGVTLESDSVPVGLNHDHDWQIKLNTGNGMGQAIPVLRVAWQADDLFFLARGEGPFTLVYGNGSLSDKNQSAAALLKLINDQEQAEMFAEALPGEVMTLKGAEALEAGLNVSWERVLLWSILTMGVLLTGFMAFRLFRQMNKTADD